MLIFSKVIFFSSIFETYKLATACTINLYQAVPIHMNNP